MKAGIAAVFTEAPSKEASIHTVEMTAFKEYSQNRTQMMDNIYKLSDLYKVH